MKGKMLFNRNYMHKVITNKIFSAVRILIKIVPNSSCNVFNLIEYYYSTFISN